MGGSASVPFDYEAQLFADTEKQSQTIDSPEGEDCSPIYRALGCDKLTTGPTRDNGEPLTSIWDAFEFAVEKYPDKDYFGTRVFDDANGGKYKWQTYKQVYDQALAIGEALKTHGHSAHENIGLFSVNRAEWMIAALGIYSQDMRTVALYATLGAEAVEYITTFADITTMFVSKESLSSIIKLLDKIPHVKTIVQFDVDAERYGNTKDTVDEEDIRVCKKKGVELIGFTKMVKENTKDAYTPQKPTLDSISHIMFTSGTTGLPKGAIISHGNVLAAVSAIMKTVELRPDDSHISYLPLAHIFETDMQVGFMLAGGKIGFFQGDVKKLTDDFVALRPTILAGVPRVFTKVYQKVFAGVSSKACTKRFVFHKGYAAQAEAVRAGITARYSLYDNKVFTPLAHMIGLDKTRIVVSGAAPLPPYLMEFLKIVVNCNVVQGYGMTETAAGLTVSMENDNTVGHVGPPVPCCEVKLRSVPEMGYDAKGKVPKGEVLVRGPNIFKGYLKNEKATKETIDSDGWLATGDVGRWNPNGSLSIIDRKKNIFKLSQGEYVAAEHLEAVYGKCPLVGQIWVYGNSFKSFVLAVVVPSADRFVEYGEHKGYWTHSTRTIGSEGYSEAFKKMWDEHHDELKKHLRDALKEQESVLKGFEKVRDIHIEANLNNLGIGFTEENNCMTPTFKLRRPFLLKRYHLELRELYKTNGEEPKPDEKWPGEE